MRVSTLTYIVILVLPAHAITRQHRHLEPTDRRCPWSGQRRAFGLNGRGRTRQSSRRIRVKNQRTRSEAMRKNRRDRAHAPHKAQKRA